MLNVISTVRVPTWSRPRAAIGEQAWAYAEHQNVPDVGTEDGY
jgi:hypothetical protein